MAVYAPGDDPPPPAVDPGMWARIMDYARNLNPIGSAHAAESVTRGSPGPSPVDPRLAGPGVSTAALSVPNYGGLPAGVATMAPDRMNGLPTTFGGGPFGQGGPAPPVMPYAGGQGPVAGVGGRPDLAPAQPNTFAGWPSPVASGNVTTGPAWYGDPRIGTDQPSGGPSALIGRQPGMRIVDAPTPPPRPVGLGIPPNARGEVAAPPAQSPWFTTDYRPNQDPGLGGGALTSPRGSGGPSQMGMLDLSGLFGGAKQPAAAAAPRKINVGKIPASARAEVPPEAPGRVDPSIIARQRMRRPKASSSSQGGGY